MKTFNDNAGHTWTLTINVDVIKRVRCLVDVMAGSGRGGGEGTT